MPTNKVDHHPGMWDDFFPYTHLSLKKVEFYSTSFSALQNVAILGRITERRIQDKFFNVELNSTCFFVFKKVSFNIEFEFVECQYIE